MQLLVQDCRADIPRLDFVVVVVLLLQKQQEEERRVASPPDGRYETQSLCVVWEEEALS